MALAASAVMLVPGCTVPVGAVTGISVTADGRPMGVMLVCHHHIDVAILYVERGEPKDDEHVGRWTRTTALTGFATWPLDAGGHGWTAAEPVRTLAPGRVYTLYGATKDNSWSAASVSFTAEDLAALAPGRVRYYAVRSDTDRDGTLTTSMRNFRAEACEGL